MSIEPIGLAIMLFGLVSIFIGKDLAITLFIPLTLLGAAAAILLSSGTIQPPHLFIAFVALAFYADRQGLDNFVHSLGPRNPTFWVLSFNVYAVLSAVFFPRLFSGLTQVNAIGISDYGPALLMVPLGPTSGNITQSIYITANTVCFILITIFITTGDRYLVMLRAVYIYSILNIFFAVADILTFWTNTAYLLGFIRNAAYVLHIEEAGAGLHRIAGSFTETSSFSYATTGILCFALRLFIIGVNPGLNGCVAVVSLSLLLLSTSSTAIVVTPLVLLYQYGLVLLDVLGRKPSRTRVLFLISAPTVILSAIVYVLLNAEVYSALKFYLDVTVLEKASSESGVTRASWNASALANYLETYGIGGGLGSIRASSFVLALLSNTGTVGLVIFSFILFMICRPKDEYSSDIVCAMRSAGCSACVGLLLAGSVSGALVDLGLMFYVFAAIACKKTSSQDVQRLQNC